MPAANPRHFPTAAQQQDFLKNYPSPNAATFPKKHFATKGVKLKPKKYNPTPKKVPVLTLW